MDDDDAAMHPLKKSNVRFKREEVDVILRPVNWRDVHDDLCKYDPDRHFGCVLACHKAALSETSAVFQDLFAATGAGTGVTFDGVPVIDVTERFRDVDWILNLVYDSQSTAQGLLDEAGTTHSQIARIPDLYELAHKWSMPELESLLEHLLLASGPEKIGAGNFLDISRVLKERGKTFIADRMMQAVLDSSFDTLKTSGFRRAVRRMPLKDGFHFYEQLFKGKAQTGLKLKGKSRGGNLSLRIVAEHAEPSTDSWESGSRSESE